MYLRGKASEVIIVGLKVHHTEWGVAQTIADDMRRGETDTPMNPALVVH